MEEDLNYIDQYLANRKVYYLDKIKAKEFVINQARFGDDSYEQIKKLVKKDIELAHDYFLDVILVASLCYAGKIELAKDELKTLVKRLIRQKSFAKIIDLEIYLEEFSIMLNISEYINCARYMLGLDKECHGSVEVSIVDMTLNPMHFLKSTDDFLRLFEMYKLLDRFIFLKAFVQSSPNYRIQKNQISLLRDMAKDFETTKLRELLKLEDVVDTSDKEVQEMEEITLESLRHVIEMNSDEKHTLVRSAKLVEIAHYRELVFSSSVTLEILKNSLYEMGRLYGELGEEKIAKTLYMKVLALDEDFRRVKERLLEIDED